MDMDYRLLVAGLFVAFVAAKIRALTRAQHHFDASSGFKDRRERLLALTERMPNPRLALVDSAGLKREFFLNKDGLMIHFRVWNPTPGFHPALAGIVILVHGLGEHVSRYNTVAQFFNRQGFAVYGLDHQGHGRSEGDRMFLNKFDDFVDDVLQLTDIAVNDHPNFQDRVIILGHSMGGAIVSKTLLKAQPKFKGAILTGPALMADPKTAPKWLQNVAKFLSRTLPRLSLDPIPPLFIAADKSVVDWYVNDPLIVHAPMQARIAGELLGAMEEILDRANEITLPFIILHGEDDMICNFQGSEKFFEAASSTNKTLVPLKGLRHEILFEAYESKAIPQAVDWAKKIISS